MYLYQVELPLLNPTFEFPSLKKGKNTIAIIFSIYPCNYNYDIEDWEIKDYDLWWSRSWIIGII